MAQEAAASNWGRSLISKKTGVRSRKPDVKRPTASVFWIALGIFITTLAVYARVADFAFVNFDDPDYVSANLHVRHGLTGPNIVWALKSVEAANWFPVTRLSYLFDSQFFGLRPGAFHLTNLVLHALAAVVLFLFLNRATQAPWPSAFVGAIFALHPLHVESVAWIAERKDVLCALFWFVALWAYVAQPRRYIVVLAAFCLGLMSKPMIISLPIVLLLLDVWPLRRPWSRRLIWEKLPCFALAAVAALAAFLTQRGSGAVEALTVHPIGLRIENALVSYVLYIAKTFWPTGLAVFYPYPTEIPVWKAAAAFAVLAAATFAVVRFRRDRPHLVAGWFWFLVTLLPVIGLVQVGAQSRADRYMYVPMVGLLIMLAWSLPIPSRPVFFQVAVVACALLTWIQAGYWRNSETLFQHALDVTHDNDVAHHNLGNALMETGRVSEAIPHFEAALKIRPNSPRTHTDLGNALSTMPGRLPDAVAEYQAAIHVAPDEAIPHNDFGNVLAKTGRLPEAIVEYRAALRINPNYAEAHNNLGSALAKLGRGSEAIEQFQAALRIDPDYAEAHNNLGSALADVPGRLPDAISEYETALRIKPGFADAQVNLGIALANDPARLPEAISHYESALQQNPNSAEAHTNLGNALARTPGGLPRAIAEYEAALRLDPKSAEAHYNLGVALSKTGRLQDAISHFEAALRMRPDYAGAHNNLGVALSQMPGRLPDAMKHFEAAVRIKPDYFDARYNLGAALANSGRPREAREQFEAALRIRNDPEVRAMLERLR